MKMLEPIFGVDEMFYCSVPVPPINDHKDPNYTFDFTSEQIAGYGQSQTHPSIVYIPNGWNGHKYWLATTPYPNSLGVFENPCIYYGDEDNDGNPPRVFTPISGTVSGNYVMINNPIVKVQNNTVVNSDPDLYFDETNQIMYLYSRSNNFSPKRGYLQKSLSGQSWTERDNNSYMSQSGQPSVTKIGNDTIIYELYPSYAPAQTDAAYPPSENAYAMLQVWKGGISDISSFIKDGFVTFKGKHTINPYHQDVFKDESTGKYYMVFCGTNSNSNPSDYECGVFLAESEDGYTWTVFARPLLFSCDKARSYYRPTACIKQSDRTLIVYWSTTSGIIKTADQYPNGASDIPVDNRTIGLSYGSFDRILFKLKNDFVTNIV